LTSLSHTATLETRKDTGLVAIVKATANENALRDRDNDHRHGSSSRHKTRGQYVFGSGPGWQWSDYQFRSNFPIAMVAVPELFDPVHTLGALRLAGQHLCGPLGMKTLDEVDLQYCPYYDNSNDSDNPATAKGRNYRQVRVYSFHHSVSLILERFLAGARVGMAARVHAKFVRNQGPHERIRS